ncbi:Os07g0207800, partial [Oryza sativa Japonica Group]
GQQVPRVHADVGAPRRRRHVGVAAGDRIVHPHHAAAVPCPAAAAGPHPEDDPPVVEHHHWLRPLSVAPPWPPVVRHGDRVLLRPVLLAVAGGEEEPQVQGGSSVVVDGHHQRASQLGERDAGAVRPGRAPRGERRAADEGRPPLLRLEVERRDPVREVRAAQQEVGDPAGDGHVPAPRSDHERWARRLPPPRVLTTAAGDGEGEHRADLRLAVHDRADAEHLVLSRRRRGPAERERAVDGVVLAVGNEGDGGGRRRVEHAEPPVVADEESHAVARRRHRVRVAPPGGHPLGDVAGRAHEVDVHQLDPAGVEAVAGGDDEVRVRVPGGVRGGEPRVGQHGAPRAAHGAEAARRPRREAEEDGVEQALTFYSCKNLKVEYLKVVNSQQIQISVEDCTDVMVSRLSITAPETAPNTDGIHITRSRDVEVTDCMIKTGDDCMSIEDGTENLHVKNMVCGPGHGISIGSLGDHNSEAHVNNVTVDNVRLYGTANGARIKTWQGGKGSAKNIVFQNMVMDNVWNPIIIDQNYCDSSTPCKQQVYKVKTEFWTKLRLTRLISWH